MKLRHAILLEIGIIWMVLFGIVMWLPHTSWQVLCTLILSSLAAFLFLYGWLYERVIKRLETLNNHLLQKRFTNHVNLPGKDEISTLASQVNQLMDIIHQAEEKISLQWKEREQEQSTQSLSEFDLSLPSQNLPQLAHYDELTTLPNRVFFNEMLNKTLSHAERHNKILAILFIDLDRFKNINNALGEKVGNEILKEIAIRFSKALRSGDLIARLGGDEFIVLLNDINHPKFASPVAEKLLQVCSAPIQVKGREFFLTASIGICIYPNDGKSLEDLQKNADLALYKAKRVGGGVYQYFTSEMTLEANKHIQLEQALHKALDNKEFVLFFQPKLDLNNGTINGCEALIRWINPEIGLIAPGDFIIQAEENGLIIPIGTWVLKEACGRAQSWQEQGFSPVTIAVNISPRQFADQDIVTVVAQALKESGLNPNYLEIEITETIVMENVDAAIEKIAAIKALGVKICIDDFGTGYTSISYLKKFPIDVLKVDQSFVKGIPQNQNDMAITSAIIALGHNLSMTIVAEGVETAEQVQFLVDHHCDQVQGYYFSRPLPEQKMVLLLKR